MQGIYTETTSIKSEEKLLDIIKSNKVLFGSLVFAVVTLIYFVSLNYIDPADTEVIVNANSNDGPKLVKEVVVHISGAVKKPGVYEVSDESRVADVVSEAGGLLVTSNVNWITKQLNLSSIVKDQQKIYIPFEWEKDLGVVNDVGKINKILDQKQDESKEDTQKTENLQKSDLISVNSATKSTLMDLSGIGEVYAQKIINNRPYVNLEAFKQQSDIPESTIEKIAKKITFD